MEKKILLVGLGNIGLRHLQGIILSKKNYNIYLYDKEKKKYEIARKIIKAKKNSKHKFFF